jgi:HTH-type transcriptional regulator/antitoxin HipB
MSTNMRQTSLTNSAQLRQIIASRRRTMKLSQQNLAMKLGISQNRMSEIESGNARLTVDRLVDLLKILGLEMLVQDRQASERGDW